MLTAYLAAAFILPSIAKKLLFRAALMPHPLKRISRIEQVPQCIFWVVRSVLWNPINAVVVRPVIAAAAFLVNILSAAARLGATAMVLYARSGLAEIILHWLVVVACKTMFVGRVISFGPPAAS